MHININSYAFSYGMNPYILLMEWKGSHIQKTVFGENYLTKTLLYMNYVVEMNAE